MKFRCRMVLPRETKWFEVDSPSWGEAANDLHTYKLSHEGFRFFASVDENPHGDGFLDVSFALMEVEGHGEVVSRFYNSGIYRKGGLKPQLSAAQRLKLVADKLGWTKDPMMLIEPGWEEESPEWESKSMSKHYEEVQP